MKKLIPKLLGAYLNLLGYLMPNAAGRKGFYLFCTPFSVPLKPHQKKFLDNSSRSSFVSDGNTIQVYRWGTGSKKVLFLHGWQSHSFRWKNYIESFPLDEYTIYAFDAPGHGQSGGKYLNIPLYSQVIERFLTLHHIDTIVSHSLGSFATLYTFFRYPALAVNQLILTASPGEAKEFFAFYQNVLGLSPRTIHLVRIAFLEIIGQFPEYFSASDFAKGIKASGLIIHDEQDEEAPFHHAVNIHRAWKNSKLIATTALGHNLRSSLVVNHVFEFVHQSEPRKEVQEKKELTYS